MPLAALLRLEIDALRAVLGSLEVEREALEQRSAEALIAASQAKVEAVNRATQLEKEHRDFLAANQGAQAAPDNLKNELKDLATQCRRLNEANGHMIRGQRRRIEGSLNVLRGGRAAPDTYGRDGETRTLRGARTTLASY